MGELFLILLGGSIYFAPSIWAVGKRNTGAIFALNLLLGWTFLGWVGALIWAIMSKPDIKPVKAISAPVIYCPQCEYDTRSWKDNRVYKCVDCDTVKHYLGYNNTQI